VVRTPAKAPTHVLGVYLHNGYSMSVEANEQSIQVLKALLVPNLQVKAMNVYGGNPVTRLEHLNYTELTRLRKEQK